jgi:hypothetical protein
MTYLVEAKRNSGPSSVHLGHFVDRVLVAGEVKSSFCPGPRLVAFDTGPWRRALSGPS